MTTAEGWGAAFWGATPWGTGEPALELVGAQAVRENTVRVEFTAAPLFDGLLTPHDASDPRRFSVVAVSGIGLDGEPVRSVLPVLIQVAGVPGGGGRFLDVWVDRPFTAWPSVYRVSANALVSSSGGSILAAGSSSLFDGVRAGKAPPTVEYVSASRDILIAQTSRELIGANVSGDPSKLIGVIPVDATGDYASGTPIAGYRTRVIRRAISAINSFAHLPPGYGTLLPSSVKKPFKQSNADDIAAQVQAQVALEPETVSCSVTASQGPNGVVVYKILAQSRIGDVELSIPT